MQKIITSTIILSFFFAIDAYSQQNSDIWKTLTKIGWKKEFNEYVGTEMEMPLFSEEVKALNGEEVIIEGFVLPLDLSQGDYLILSMFPYASCFFCGNAGPETVMEVYMKEPKPYAADEKVTFKGKLKLNYDDAMHLVYMLQDAEPIKVE